MRGRDSSTRRRAVPIDSAFGQDEYVMSAVAVAFNRVLAARRLISARIPMPSLASLLVGIVLFKLALSDGGRHAPTLAFAQIAIYLTVIALLLAGRISPTPVASAMIAIIVVTAVSTIWSVRPAATVRVLLQWLMYAGITAAVGASVTSARGIRWLADTIVVIAGWLCLVALFTFWGAGNPAMRWYSTFYWPNPFAAFLLLALPIEICRTVWAGTRRDAVAHGMLATLLGTALVLTYSRGAMLSLLVVLPLVVIVLQPSAWKRAVGRGLLLTGAVLAAAVVVTQGAVLGVGQDEKRAAADAVARQLSIQGRAHFWRAAWAIFLDHPAGAGAGTFGAMHAAYQRDVRFYATDAHNLYLQTAAETGVPGLVALTAVLGTTGMVWRRAHRRSQHTDLFPLTAGIGVALLVFFAHSAIEMNWMFPANPATAAALIGMLASIERVASGGTVPARAPSGRFAAAAALCLAVVAVVFGWTAQRESLRGQVFARAGNWPAAAQAYARAARWNPLQAQYYAARAAAVMRSASPDRELAEVVLHRAMALDRMNASHPLQLAGVLTAPPGTARVTETDSLLRYAIQLDPLNRPEAYRRLARLYVQEDRAADAGRILRDASARYVGRQLATGIPYLLLWPEVAGLQQDWAAWLIRDGRPQEAIEVLTGLLRDDPTWMPAALDLAAIYVRQGRRPDAAAVLVQGLARAPANEVLWARLQRLQTPSTRIPQ